MQSAAVAPLASKLGKQLPVIPGTGGAFAVQPVTAEFAVVPVISDWPFTRMLMQLFAFGKAVIPLPCPPVKISKSMASEFGMAS